MKIPQLKIAEDISLPLDIVTQTIAILAKRRAGKSYTMRRLVEQLIENEQQVVLVDPKGDQWGIRSSSDGKNPGLPIVILGGEHGDVPLEVNAGEVVAKLVVEKRVSILLDLSVFRKHEVATFMTAFLENLYRLKAKEEYRTPVMLVVDEADAIAPQKPQKGEERMLGAAEDIVRRGGQRGIGCALITQRSAVLNKNVLTQAQMLIVLRTIAPQDLAAMKAWIDVHGDLEQGKTLMDSLPSLPVGDAWFWSPGWPTSEGIFVRSHVLPITTFDSGATPKPGEKKITPKNLADIDLDVLKTDMAATIEKAKSENPTALKKKIAELERELKSKQNPIVQKTSDPKSVERAVSAAIVKRDKEWAKVVKSWQSFAGRMMAAIDIFKQLDIEQIPDDKPKDTFMGLTLQVDHAVTKRFVALRTPKQEVVIQNDGEMVLSNPEKKILTALAWFESIGITAPEQAAVAFLAGYTVGGGAFNNPRGSLRTKGLIEYNGDCLILTEEGKKFATYPEQPLTTEDLHRAVLGQLPGPEKRLMEVILNCYPHEISNEELAHLTGYQVGGGAFNNPRGRLRSLGLIEYRNGNVKARDILFID